MDQFFLSPGINRELGFFIYLLVLSSKGGSMVSTSPCHCLRLAPPDKLCQNYQCSVGKVGVLDTRTNSSFSWEKLGARGLFLIIWLWVRARTLASGCLNLPTSFGESGSLFALGAGPFQLLSEFFTKEICLWIIAESVSVKGQRVQGFLLHHLANRTPYFS